MPAARKAATPPVAPSAAARISSQIPLMSPTVAPFFLVAERSLARACLDGQLTPDAIGPAELAARLETADIPDPDLLIRTSGEMRISNFLLWQLGKGERQLVRAHLLGALAEQPPAQLVDLLLQQLVLA